MAHQAKGMHLPGCFLAGFGQGLEEIAAVKVIEINVLASISATHDVVHGSRIFNAQLARNERVGIKVRAKVDPETKQYMD
jgi:hypothetical protein